MGFSNSGVELWSLQLPNAGNGETLTPIIGPNGTIYVQDAGYLYAIGVPEPSTLALLAAGAIALLGYGLRRRSVRRTAKPAPLDPLDQDAPGHPGLPLAVVGERGTKGGWFGFEAGARRSFAQGRCAMRRLVVAALGFRFCRGGLELRHRTGPGCKSRRHCSSWQRCPAAQAPRPLRACSRLPARPGRIPVESRMAV